MGAARVPMISYATDLEVNARDVFAMGTAPAEFGYTLIPNDLIWWIPFVMMLNHARKAGFPLR